VLFSIFGCIHLRDLLDVDAVFLAQFIDAFFDQGIGPKVSAQGR